MPNKTTLRQQYLSDDEHAKWVPFCRYTEKAVYAVGAAVPMKRLNGDIRKQNATETSSAFFHRLVVPESIEQPARAYVHYAAGGNKYRGAESEAERASPAFDG